MLWMPLCFTVVSPFCRLHFVGCVLWGKGVSHTSSALFNVRNVLCLRP